MKTRKLTHTTITTVAVLGTTARRFEDRIQLLCCLPGQPPHPWLPKLAEVRTNVSQRFT